MPLSGRRVSYPHVVLETHTCLVRKIIVDERNEETNEWCRRAAAKYDLVTGGGEKRFGFETFEP